jgi:hypothetical protein
MDKLFDLMMMGLKYQLMCSTKLEALQQVGGGPGMPGAWVRMACVAQS